MRTLLRKQDWFGDFIKNLVDSRVLRNKRLQTPSGPEGSSGSNPLCVPQGSLAINKLFRIRVDIG